MWTVIVKAAREPFGSGAEAFRRVTLFVADSRRGILRGHQIQKNSLAYSHARNNKRAEIQIPREGGKDSSRNAHYFRAIASNSKYFHPVRNIGSQNFPHLIAEQPHIHRFESAKPRPRRK